MARPAVFLERDGVLNVEVGYIHRVEDLHLIPGVAQAVLKLKQHPYYSQVQLGVSIRLPM